MESEQSIAPVLIAGQWRPAPSSESFAAWNPATGEPLEPRYPVSPWDDCDQALDAAAGAAEVLRDTSPEKLAGLLEGLAARIERGAEELVALAHLETALPIRPRLADVELPRTTGQLRQAAAAAREGSWALPTIDTRAGIRSLLAPLGPVAVFGPNNFPLAFNSVAGGDFAAALAAGNPVIAKSNTSHPGTTRWLAAAAHEAALEAGLPSGTIQLIYRTSHGDGRRLVADPRLGATGYTGSRAAGLELKAAADAVGKPIYLELSSVNPVVILPGALAERGEALAEEFAGSCLLGTGQFCTNPGLVILLKSPAGESFLAEVARRFSAAPVGVLLSAGVARNLAESVAALLAAGAALVVGGQPVSGPGYRFANTLLRASAEQFLADPHAFQREAFGNATLVIEAHEPSEVLWVIDALEGNLTGSIYSAQNGSDDAAYARLASRLRRRVGRLLNDKMPTGVAVSSAMNHGGPYPATGHPGFTAVGIPAALRRFAALECYDNVRPARLPRLVADCNPTGQTWRLIDGAWTRDDVPLAPAAG